MIVDTILGWLGSAWSWLVGIFPSFETPDWLGSLTSAAGAVGGFGADLSSWFPFGMAGGALGFVITGWLIGVGIKVIRIVISLLTAGGGSAA